MLRSTFRQVLRAGSSGGSLHKIVLANLSYSIRGCHLGPQGPFGNVICFSNFAYRALSSPESDTYPMPLLILSSVTAYDDYLFKNIHE
jgi:hypothetical protein